jgi:hypothetical protein
VSGEVDDDKALLCDRKVLLDVEWKARAKEFKVTHPSAMIIITSTGRPLICFNIVLNQSEPFNGV